MKLAKCIKIAAALSAILLCSCAQNPVTGQQNFVMMTEKEEIATGKRTDAELRKEYNVYNSPALQNYVHAIGKKLIRNSHRPNLNYHFTVVDSPEINAFALPGGYIYVTRGMLAYLNSEAELAAVLGHEIGHVTARHSVQRHGKMVGTSIVVTLASALIPQLAAAGAQNLMGIMGSAIFAGYGREHELEADRLGSEYIARSGYNPQAMINVIGVLKNQELFDAEIAKQENREPRAYHGIFASHPDNDDRLKQVVREAEKYISPTTEEGRSVYLMHINNLIFGDSPQQGITRNHVFYHSDLGFVLNLPREWRTKNSPEQLIVTSPSGDAIIKLFVDKPTGSPAELLKKNLNLEGAEVIEITINQLPAAIISGDYQSKPVKVAAIYLNDKAYIISTIVNSSEISKKYTADFETTIKSFRKITEVDRKIARPFIIKTITAQRNMTYNKLAKNSPIGKNAESYLRLMNNAYPSGEPQENQVIKIIE